MVLTEVFSEQTIIEAYTKGLSPRLLIHMLTHGDEWRVKEPLLSYISGNEQILPDFMVVPAVSPSAAESGTRKNKFGNDVNREFWDETIDPEVIANMKLLEGKHFDLILSVHEDYEHDGFYFYDNAGRDIHTESFLNALRHAGTKLFTGIDDPDDKALKYEAENGYIFAPLKSEPDGTFEDWAVRKGIVERIFTLEVPTNFSSEEKALVIEMAFQYLVLPQFGRSLFK